MDLNKLFQMQKELGTVGLFNYKEPDRFEKLILALLVELGECAQEWRGFKFWSVNQLPHISAVRVPCMMDEDKEFYNPLLEEYVDGLHFVLEVGLEFESVEKYYSSHNIKTHSYDNITVQFIWINNSTSSLFQYKDEEVYEILVYEYLALGFMLGFTWEEIEQAYMAKHKINLQRQEVGY